MKCIRHPEYDGTDGNCDHCRRERDGMLGTLTAKPRPDVDLKKLRGLAEAAYPGPWQTDGSIVSSLDDYRLGIEEDTVCDEVSTEENAAFIAAFNPQTALALIAVAEAANTVYGLGETALVASKGSNNATEAIIALGHALNDFAFVGWKPGDKVPE